MPPDHPSSAPYAPPEQQYLADTTPAHRKRYGQFFTPAPLARLMGDWLLGADHLRTVLEPAFGLGVFSRHLLAQKPALQVEGYEIDPVMRQAARACFAGQPQLALHATDYVYAPWEARYDGIICNPPYAKFHDYDNRPALAELATHTGYELNGFTNLYAIFLLKSLHQLAPGGRAAYLIPSEFLNADYGKRVKQYLLDSGYLRWVTVIDFRETIFADALTTACLVLLARDAHDDQVAFTSLARPEELAAWAEELASYPQWPAQRVYPRASLVPAIKWRRYYQPVASEKFRGLIPFSQVAKVSRGIATGANAYFMFNREKADQHDIPAANLLPCIAKATDVPAPFFTQDHFDQLAARNRNVWLFNGQHQPDERVAAYLQVGIDRGIDQRYLTSKRNPWYALEQRPPAPIWVSVFNRNGLRFVRNEAMVRNLTTFHCVYLNLFSAAQPDLLFAYLLTPVSREMFDDNRREYGNGLQKFEPNDLNQAMMLDLASLPAPVVEETLARYHAYRTSVLQGVPDATLLNSIDQGFRHHFGA